MLSGCHCANDSDRVTRIVVRAGDQQIQVEWDPVPGCRVYEIYWDNQPDINRWAPAYADRVEAPPFRHMPVVNGRRYCYRVSAYHGGRPTEPSDAVCATAGAVPRPWLSSIEPSRHRPGSPFELVVNGTGFAPEASVLLDGEPVPTRFDSQSRLLAELPALAPRISNVRVRQGLEDSNRAELSIGQTSPPRIANPGDQTVEEGKRLALTIEASDPDGDPIRLYAEGLPPGARWDEAARSLTFEPTFIQGGDTWSVRLTADDGSEKTEESFLIQALDTIAPPSPVVERTEELGDSRILTLSQTSDAWLDSPGYAGRRFEAKLVVPATASASNRMPVRIQLHGYQGAPIPAASAAEFRLYPSDPMDTYWYGYSEKLPGGRPEDGTVPDYTARRVLRLLEWVLRSYPGADPERVYLYGSSMGGSGALAIGLLYARHFACAEAFHGETVARNHRPTRIAQLQGLWGAPSVVVDGRAEGAWDAMDMTRALASLLEAREQYLLTKHGKDDPIIHFGAAVLPSPLTGASFFEALQQEQAGHLAIWDESGHDVPDPVLGNRWWDGGWDPVHDPVTFLRRDTAFPAFSRCSSDREPGDGSGNGAHPWSVDSGYAGSPAVAGDTGWSGELAGARNRFLRWNAAAVVDEPERAGVPLRLLDGAGGPAPREGYPTTGDRLDGSLPVRADVTLRRTQRFRCLPGETIRWSFGRASGVVTANADGSVTVPQLEIPTEWRTLWLERS